MAVVEAVLLLLLLLRAENQRGVVRRETARPRSGKPWVKEAQGRRRREKK